MNKYGRRFIFLTLAVFLTWAPPAGAQSESSNVQAPRRGFSIGARGAYYRPKSADHGDWAQGIQARLHFFAPPWALRGSAWALEGSLDLRQDTLDGTSVDTIPLQFSLVLYLLPPGHRIAPYLLAGGGWYYTHIGAPIESFHFRFGPHVGVGIECFVNDSWSIDASYRNLWTQDINSQDIDHPLGRNFSVKGRMFTSALNYHF